ncbi:MAG: 50S ribosomal protein L11 methyltransferase [Nevskia sp.]|nr:50S ribosomal protein L11 methyltransferase [Nevskia sp.]
MWNELLVNSRYPDFAEEALLAQGAVSVTMTDAADEPVLEPAPGATPLWQHTITRGLFHPEVDLEQVRRVLRELLPDGAELVFEQRKVEDKDWINAWLQHAKPMRFGAEQAPGLWICPSGHRVDEAGAAVVQLDPGLAFGTGTHPSTALCLEWLALHDVTGKRVLDYGCGSGILAIAALKRGALHADAVDIDPQALIATQGNARINGVDGRLRCAGVAQFTEQAVDESVDIVLANILAKPLMQLAPMLAQRLRNGGSIVLAGVLQSQADEVRSAYAPWFDFDEDGQREDWARISGTRRVTVA